MTNPWIGVVASLGGVTVGAVTTYLTQDRLWRRTTRRELYGSYLGKSTVCHDALLAVRSTVKRKVLAAEESGSTENHLRARWDAANREMAETSALSGQVSMVATEPTRTAAEKLEQHLRDVKAELDRNNKARTEPRSYEDYRAEYASLREEFLAAASKELKIARTQRHARPRAGRAAQ
jgi:hypothetical protein